MNELLMPLLEEQLNNLVNAKTCEEAALTRMKIDGILEIQAASNCHKRDLIWIEHMVKHMEAEEL